MIVEDNAADLALMLMSIATAGLDCAMVHYGDSWNAIAHIHSEHLPVADLVVLDLNLPTGDGSQVLREIRASTRWLLVPVIVFSTSDAVVDEKRLRMLGADAYVVKPWNLEEYLKISNHVRTWLGKSHTR